MSRDQDMTDGDAKGASNTDDVKGTSPASSQVLAKKMWSRGWRGSGRSGDWWCSECSTHNYSQRVTCIGCGVHIADAPAQVVLTSPQPLSSVVSARAPVKRSKRCTSPESVDGLPYTKSDNQSAAGVLRQQVSAPDWDAMAVQCAQEMYECPKELQNSTAIKAADQNLNMARQAVAQLKSQISVKRAAVAKLNEELEGLFEQERLLGAVELSRSMELVSCHRVHVVSLKEMLKQMPMESDHVGSLRLTLVAAQENFNKVKEQALIHTEDIPCSRRRGGAKSSKRRRRSRSPSSSPSQSRSRSRTPSKSRKEKGKAKKTSREDRSRSRCSY